MRFYPVSESIILVKSVNIGDTSLLYRLIETFDGEKYIYSVILTSFTDDCVSEAFIYELAQEKEPASELICRMADLNVTPDSVHELFDDDAFICI